MSSLLIVGLQPEEGVYFSLYLLRCGFFLFCPMCRRSQLFLVLGPPRPAPEKIVLYVAVDLVCLWEESEFRICLLSPS